MRYMSNENNENKYINMWKIEPDFETKNTVDDFIKNIGKIDTEKNKSNSNNIPNNTSNNIPNNISNNTSLQTNMLQNRIQNIQFIEIDEYVINIDKIRYIAYGQNNARVYVIGDEYPFNINKNESIVELKKYMQLFIINKNNTNENNTNENIKQLLARLDRKTR